MDVLSLLQGPLSKVRIAKDGCLFATTQFRRYREFQ